MPRDPEKTREHKRRYYQANLEKLREYARHRRHTNLEKYVEYGRRYYQANPEKFREKNRRYCQANQEKVREYNRRQNRKEKNRLRRAARLRCYRLGIARTEANIEAMMQTIAAQWALKQFPELIEIAKAEALAEEFAKLKNKLIDHEKKSGPSKNDRSSGH